MTSCSEVPGNRSGFQLVMCLGLCENQARKRFMCYRLPRRDAGHEESMADRYLKFTLGMPLQADPRGLNLPSTQRNSHWTAMGLLALQTHGM